MKAKRRITAIVTSLAMMLTVQPLYAGTAVAATIIPNNGSLFNSDISNNQFDLEDVDNCSGISITGTGNTLIVSGVNSISGTVGSNLSIKLTNAKFGSPMLSATSLDGANAVNLSDLSFTNLINFGSLESHITDLIRVSGGSILSTISGVTGKTGTLNDQSVVVTSGEDTTTNGVKVRSEVRGSLSMAAAGSAISIEGVSVTPECSSINSGGIDISNWNPDRSADTLKGWSRPDGTYAVYGKLPMFSNIAGTEKTILSSNTDDFFDEIVRIDSSIAYGTAHSFEKQLTGGVVLSGTHTGGVKVSDDKKSLVYVPGTVTAEKITFTNVDWKDTGALINHSNVLSGVSFNGIDVDTSNISFKNIPDLDANKKMTLVSGFGDTVGTVTGSRYTLSNNYGGGGKASLQGNDLTFTSDTKAVGNNSSGNNANQKDNWDDARQVINGAPAGTTISVGVDAKDLPVVPSDVVEAVKGKDINIALASNNGAQVIVNGNDITGNVTGGVNLGVDLNTNGIPQDTIEAAFGKGTQTMQLEFGNASAFPLKKAILVVPAPSLVLAPYANIYQYGGSKHVETGAIKGLYGTLQKSEKEVSNQSPLRFISSGKVAGDGTVSLVIDGSVMNDASATNKFVIVFANHSLDPNASKTDPKKLTLKSKIKSGKIVLSWNKLKEAKKYRICQKVGNKYKTISTLKKTSLTIKKAYQKIKKNRKSLYKLKKLSKNKKFVFVVKAYIDGKWTKVTASSTKTVKMK